MLLYLLAFLLAIHSADYQQQALHAPTADQALLIDNFESASYDPPFQLNRALPPLRSQPFVFPGVVITAQSAVVLDVASGEALYAKGTAAVLPIASLTKLMTAMVFLEHSPGLDAEVTIVAEDSRDTEGSRLYVGDGEKVTVRDLFYSSLVGSANNATKALARSTGLPSEEFVAEMNKRAAVLGLGQTKFFDVTGLNPGNVSTVLEYSRVAAAAFRNATIREALSLPEYDFETVDRKIRHTIKNTDLLLENDALSLVGAKTGYLNEAGYTFACQAEQAGRSILVVLLGSASSDARFKEAAELIDWTFRTHRWL